MPGHQRSTTHKYRTVSVGDCQCSWAREIQRAWQILLFKVAPNACVWCSTVYMLRLCPCKVRIERFARKQVSTLSPSQGRTKLSRFIIAAFSSPVSCWELCRSTQVRTRWWEPPDLRDAQGGPLRP